MAPIPAANAHGCKVLILSKSNHFCSNFASILSKLPNFEN